MCNFLFQGKIACANVLSDLYAMGVSECDNMLMLLGVSETFSYTQRQIVTPMMIQGFTGRWTSASACTQVHRLCLPLVWLHYVCNFSCPDLCTEAGTSVNGGQTVINPWVIIGGVASAVCKKSEFIM